MQTRIIINNSNYMVFYSRQVEMEIINILYIFKNFRYFKQLRIT